jgi:hypothetical protein
MAATYEGRPESFPSPLIPLHCARRDVVEILLFANELLVQIIHGSG